MMNNSNRIGKGKFEMEHVEEKIEVVNNFETEVSVNQLHGNVNFHWHYSGRRSAPVNEEKVDIEEKYNDECGCSDQPGLKCAKCLVDEKGDRDMDLWSMKKFCSQCGSDYSPSEMEKCPNCGYQSDHFDDRVDCCERKFVPSMVMSLVRRLYGGVIQSSLPTMTKLFNIKTKRVVDRYVTEYKLRADDEPLAPRGVVRIFIDEHLFLPIMVNDQNWDDVEVSEYYDNNVCRELMHDGVIALLVRDHILMDRPSCPQCAASKLLHDNEPGYDDDLPSVADDDSKESYERNDDGSDSEPGMLYSCPFCTYRQPKYVHCELCEMAAPQKME